MRAWTTSVSLKPNLFPTKMSVIFVVLSVFCVLNVQTARILAIYPFASISHQVVFRPLTLELAKRGHELVVITTDPIGKEKPENVTEIDTSHVYTVLRNSMGSIPTVRGVKIPARLLSKNSISTIAKMANATFTIPEVKSLITDRKQVFDLVISESMFQLPTVAAKIFNTPLILFSSYYGTSYNYDVIGAPARHPFLTPSTYRDRFNNLSMLEKIQELYSELRLWNLFHYQTSLEEQMLQTHFPELNTNFDELNDLIDLLFVNVNPIFEGNRPMPPNIIHLGALHLKPPKELSKEWQTYLDSSKRGFIYVSLGTNVRASTMGPTLLEVFMTAFEQLPYEILWKFDGDALPRKLSNVRVENWFPQRELLFHPNIKAFITQGGLQSTDEAIDSAVPMVGLPMLADQSFNCERYEALGIGVSLEVETLTTKQLVEAVETVVENKSYRENIKRLRHQILDQPQTPLERAVWWTEYVLRHKGAKHLRSSQANISWSKYLMLDIVSVLLISATLVLIFAKFIISTVKRILKSSFKDKKL